MVNGSGGWHFPWNSWWLTSLLWVSVDKCKNGTIWRMWKTVRHAAVRSEKGIEGCFRQFHTYGMGSIAVSAFLWLKMDFRLLDTVFLLHLCYGFQCCVYIRTNENGLRLLDTVFLSQLWYGFQCCLCAPTSRTVTRCCLRSPSTTWCRKHSADSNTVPPSSLPCSSETFSRKCWKESNF